MTLLCISYVALSYQTRNDCLNQLPPQKLYKVAKLPKNKFCLDITMNVLILIVSLLPLALGITRYESCRIGGTRPYEIHIDGCDETPCELSEGQYINAYAKVIAGMYTS